MTTHQIRVAAVRRERVQVRERTTVGMVAFGTPDRAEPWQRRHVLATGSLAAMGAIGMVVCWYVGAGKLTYQDQVPWLVGSIASAGVTVLGGVVWLVSGFRQVSLLERDLTGYLTPWLAEAGAAPLGPVTPDTGLLVLGPGMSRSHRPGCLMVRGKTDLSGITPAEAAARGLSRCGVCGS